MSALHLDEPGTRAIKLPVSWTFFWTSVCSSSIANTAGNIIGHPLDTIKVRMMLETRRISASQCAYEAVATEGVRGLFKGMMQPLIGSLPLNSLVFVSSEIAAEAMRNSHPQLSKPVNHTISGAIGGFFGLFVFVPLDLLKCRAQVNKDGNLNYLKEVQTILKRQGPQGLLNGFWASFWRDIPSWAVYFGAYEWFKTQESKFVRKQDWSEQNYNRAKFLWLLHAGGMAGGLCWAISIPQDVVKSKQQTSARPISMIEAFRSLKAEGGYQRFFRGSGPTIGRGYLVNTVTLPLFDILARKLRGSEE